MDEDVVDVLDVVDVVAGAELDVDPDVARGAVEAADVLEAAEPAGDATSRSLVPHALSPPTNNAAIPAALQLLRTPRTAVPPEFTDESLQYPIYRQTKKAAAQLVTIVHMAPARPQPALSSSRQASQGSMTETS